jgi:hypothetical protein
MGAREYKSIRTFEHFHRLIKEFVKRTLAVSVVSIAVIVKKRRD